MIAAILPFACLFFLAGILSLFGDKKAPPEARLTTTQTTSLKILAKLLRIG